MKPTRAKAQGSKEKRTKKGRWKGIKKEKKRKEEKSTNKPNRKGVKERETEKKTLFQTYRVKITAKQTHKFLIM
jgi:hypothetical protein